MEPDGGDAPGGTSGRGRRPGVPAGRWTSSPRMQGAAIFHLKDFHEPLRESAGDPATPARRLREAASTGAKFVVITSPVRFIPEEIERSIMFLELRPPDVIELAEFLRDNGSQARRERVTPASARSIRWRAPCRGSRSTKRATRCGAPGRPPSRSWTRVAAGAARREAAADQPQRRHRVHLRPHRARRGRRP